MSIEVLIALFISVFSATTVLSALWFGTTRDGK